ncbi:MULTISPECIES: 4'-phosphopantetheinyl transferase superfamily protein [unclassified Streptomyces]|uniref:4'-phosphopantetheinyl transferase family protein n=1 Tax=unclassified Streptomyces TaxID=2593676 RepID=UPI000DC76083|nr:MULTISPECIES: 4'-phosphopantetheinyl transferase superfamily protein [unclassified Streptomyces]AWZ04258.1 phosphopantetheinyl transferase [Streptomyces sp. ICC4]AWZ14097.1 phosphopantetheinyl transferase [Streptomyces sp. ICC1]
MTAPALGEPLAVAGPGDRADAERVRAELRRHGSVLVYGRLADWRPGDERAPALRAVLGRDWARFEDIEHPDIRSRYAASRLLLKHAAAGALSADAADLELAYGPTGRPSLRGCDQIDISLSHTGELLVVALTSRGLIGVDAERATRRLYRPGLDRHICTPQERRDLAALAEADRNRNLVRLWTLKEAYSKAIGQGMQFRFTEFGFGRGGGGRIRVLSPDGTPGEGDEWSFRTYALVSGGVDFTVSAAVYDAGFPGAPDTEVTSMLDAEAVEAIHEALAEAAAA